MSLDFNQFKNLKLSPFFQESYPLDQLPQFSPSEPGIRYEAGLFFYLNFL